MKKALFLFSDGIILFQSPTTAPILRLTADNPAQTEVRAINSPALTVTADPALSQRAVQAALRAAQADQRAAVLLNHRAAQEVQAAHRAVVLLSLKAAPPSRRNSRRSARMKCRLSRMIDFVFIFQIKESIIITIT